MDPKPPSSSLLELQTIQALLVETWTTQNLEDHQITSQGFPHFSAHLDFSSPDAAASTINFLKILSKGKSNPSFELIPSFHSIVFQCYPIPSLMFFVRWGQWLSQWEIHNAGGGKNFLLLLLRSQLGYQRPQVSRSTFLRAPLSFPSPNHSFNSSIHFLLFLKILHGIGDGVGNFGRTISRLMLVWLFGNRVAYLTACGPNCNLPTFGIKEMKMPQIEYFYVKNRS